MIYEIWKNGKKYNEIYSDGVEYDSIRSSNLTTTVTPTKVAIKKKYLRWAKNYCGEEQIDDDYGFSFGTASSGSTDDGIVAYNLKNGECCFIEDYQDSKTRSKTLLIGNAEGIFVLNIDHQDVIKLYNINKKETVYFSEENIEVSCLNGNNTLNFFEIFLNGSSYYSYSQLFLINNNTSYLLLGGTKRIVSFSYNKNLKKIIIKYRDINLNESLSFYTNSYNSIIVVGKYLLNKDNLTLSNSFPFSDYPSDLSGMLNGHEDIRYSSNWYGEINYGSVTYYTFRETVPSGANPYTVGTAFTYFYYKDYNTGKYDRFEIGRSECAKSTQIHYLYKSDGSSNGTQEEQYYSCQYSYSVIPYFFPKGDIYFNIYCYKYSNRGDYYDVWNDGGVIRLNNDYKNSYGSRLSSGTRYYNKYYKTDTLSNFNNKEQVDKLETGGNIISNYSLNLICQKNNKNNRYINCNEGDVLFLSGNSYLVEYQASSINGILKLTKINEKNTSDEFNAHHLI